jgi:signal peptidase I
MSSDPAVVTVRADQGHALKCELAAESLRVSGRLRLRVTGWSMLPTICPGDTLIIERADARVVSEGDIVLCARENRFVVHRIVARHADAITTQGDAMPQTDPPVPDQDLLGKVASIERNGRCVVPGKKMSLGKRALATAVQHSNLAARVVVGVHGMSQRTPMENSPQIALRPSKPCQS